jgi:hypothetical protein
MSSLRWYIVIGSVIAVLACIFLGIIFAKRPKRNIPKPFGTTFNQTLAQTARPTPWLNQSNVNAAFVAPVGDRVVAANEQSSAAAATTTMPTSLQQVNTPLPLSIVTSPQRAIAMPSTTQKRPSVSPISAPLFSGGIAQSAIEGLPYLPSGNLPPQLVGALTQKSIVSTSDMNPFPLDNLDLSNMRTQTNKRNDSLWDAPESTNKNLQSFSPLIAPSIQDDPILETIMRQAQMGIYAIADKYPNDPNDEINDSFLA